MFAKNNYINLVSLFILGLVSSLFMMKYSARVTAAPAIFSGLFFILFVFLASSLDKINFANHKTFNFRTFALLLIIASLVMIIGLNFVSTETRVGRYIAIKSWLDNFKYGFYPYDAKANPSGFPFLFFLDLPFYFMGDLGYFAVFGFILFSFLLYNYSNTGKELFTRFFLLLVLPTLYYEYLVRSELFTNLTLFVAVCFIAVKFVNPKKTDIKFWSLSVLFGIMLSTRLIIFIVYFLFLLYFFRYEIIKGMVFGLTSVITFGLTLIPFIVWNPDYFWQKGPFAIQFLYLPMWVVVLAPFILLYIGWMIRDIQEFMFASGVAIFTLVAISLMVKVFQYGFYNCVVGSYFDISYFAMAVPFLLLSLKEYSVDKYLGKKFDGLLP